VADQLRLAPLVAYDRMLGLELEHLMVDGCTTKAPCGGQVAGPSPVDRRKQGLKRSLATEATGIPLAALPAPANHRDDGLLAATLDALGVVGPLPQRPTVHLDAGYDWKPCRQILAERGMVGQIAARGVPAPIQVGRRWVIERTHAWGNLYGKLRWCTDGAGWSSSSGWRWPAPSSSVAGSSAAPGPTTAGRTAHVDARDALLAQALRARGGRTVLTCSWQPSRLGRLRPSGALRRTRTWLRLSPWAASSTICHDTRSLHRSRRVVTFIRSVLKKEGTWG
jgi:hypothetical protein